MKDFIIKIDDEKYIVDKYYYKKIRSLRLSIINMKSTIKRYTEKIEVKKKFIDETYKEMKEKCQKKI